MFLWSGRLAGWQASRLWYQKSPCLWNFQNPVTWLCWTYGEIIITRLISRARFLEAIVFFVNPYN